MGSKLLHLWRFIVMSLLVPGLLPGPRIPTVAMAQQTDPVTFSGQATVLRARVLGITTVISDTGPLPSSGGALETSLLTASVPGLASAEVGRATAIGEGNNSSSEASVANVNVTVGGNTITADLLMARADAACTSGGVSLRGNADIFALAVNGQAISVSGQPNQTAPLLVGEIIVNEQSSSASGNTGSITVNALHVIVPGAADVVISSAHSDITCHAVPTCTGGDFVTGGGFITGTPSGAKGNFGVAGGIKSDGRLFGHLEYIDHGPDGPRVHGTGVTNYTIVDATTREIDGTAEVNGQSGWTYRVVVTDHGNPHDDSFSILLSTGYSAGGTLGGGNIQLHDPCQ